MNVKPVRKEVGPNIGASETTESQRGSPAHWLYRLARHKTGLPRFGLTAGVHIWERAEVHIRERNRGCAFERLLAETAVSVGQT